MQRRIIVTLALLAFSVSCVTGCKKEEKAEAPPSAPATTAPATAPAAPAPSETGGNTVNPKKPLGAKELAEHGITKEEDIVKLMRTPGAGMTKFDEATVSDSDAKKIASYVLTSFK